MMSCFTDKLVIDGQTQTHTHTDEGNDNTRRLKLASSKNLMYLTLKFLTKHALVSLQRTLVVFKDFNVPQYLELSFSSQGIINAVM